jgi:hypothetical protein
MDGEDWVAKEGGEAPFVPEDCTNFRDFGNTFLLGGKYDSVRTWRGTESYERKFLCRFL